MSSLIKERRALAENKSCLALEALRAQGVTMAFDIYAGSLRRLVKQYVLRGGLDLVMMAAKGEAWLPRLFFRNRLPPFNCSQLSKSPPVLLLRPGTSVRKE